MSGAQLDDPNREAVGLPPIWTVEAPVAKKRASSSASTSSKRDEQHEQLELPLDEGIGGK